MVGRIGGESYSICHSWPHDSQASVTVTTGRFGTVVTLRARPSPVPHAGHGRRTDMGIWGTEADCTTAHQCNGDTRQSCLETQCNLDTGQPKVTQKTVRLGRLLR
jgi:hypothetical protein